MKGDLITQLDDRQYALHHLSIEGNQVPDMRVRRGRLIGRLGNLLGADVLIGFNFFRIYSEVCFDIANRRLILSTD